MPQRLTPPARLLCVGAACLLLAGCASWPRRRETRPCCFTGKPVVHEPPIWWHLFDVTVIEPVEYSLELVRPARKLIGMPVRAANLRHGELGDSIFWTARDPAALSPAEVRAGPTRPDDMPTPPYTVTKAKTEGQTAGFFVDDARGRPYLFKLDPVHAPELLSGAEVVTSKLLYALGYHVPSYEAVTCALDEVRLSPGARMRGADGAMHPFTDDALRALLTPRAREGRVRVSSSKILDGEILGPANFKKFRDCAEMRALKVAYAWVNNIDAKDHNSLLVWDGQRTVGYLIDFGTSLGADAGSGGPKSPCAGWLNIVDLTEASLKLLTLGLHQPPCEAPSPPMSPAVGLFTETVDPQAWKPYAPNLAFAEMNEDDARWIARRMARLSREQVEAAVAAGRYSRPADAAYVTETLEQRRQSIVRRYLKEQEDR